jgi:hypothetical protein
VKLANAKAPQEIRGLGSQRLAKREVYGEEFLVGLRSRESIYIEFFAPLRYI